MYIISVLCHTVLMKIQPASYVTRCYIRFLNSCILTSCSLTRSLTPLPSLSLFLAPCRFNLQSAPWLCLAVNLSSVHSRVHTAYRIAAVHCIVCSKCNAPWVHALCRASPWLLIVMPASVMTCKQHGEDCRCYNQASM